LRGTHLLEDAGVGVLAECLVNLAEWHVDSAGDGAFQAVMDAN
jgi:hypothetical protein